MYEAIFPPYYKLGSLHALSPETIPELEQGLQVVKVWARDLLYRLNPYRPAHLFLTMLLRTARLAFIFDPKAACDYVPRVPSVSTNKPTALMRVREAEKAYVVQDFVGFMQNSEVFSLNQGVLFLKCVTFPCTPLVCSCLNVLVTSWRTGFLWTSASFAISWIISAAV